MPPLNKAQLIEFLRKMFLEMRHILIEYRDGGIVQILTVLPEPRSHIPVIELIDYADERALYIDHQKDFRKTPLYGALETWVWDLIHSGTEFLSFDQEEAEYFERTAYINEIFPGLSEHTDEIDLKRLKSHFPKDEVNIDPL